MAPVDQPQLIPGLEEEVALFCLARVPRVYHKSLRVVCRTWRTLLSFPDKSPLSLPQPEELATPPKCDEDCTPSLPATEVETGGLYEFRRQLGFAETWVYLRTRTSTFVNHWRYFDVTNQVWAPRLPEIPYIAAAVEKRLQQGGPQAVEGQSEGPLADRNKIRGLGSAAVGPRIFVFGGWQEGGPSLSDTFCYDAVSERWTSRAPMRQARCYMASAVVGSKVYVAGGMCRPRLHQSELLVSAEVYDAEEDTWTELPDMPFAMFFSCGIEMGGQVYVSGSRPPFDQGPPGRGCIFDPVQHSWRSFEDRKLGDVMLSPCASVGEWLLAVSATGIQAWNARHETWHTTRVACSDNAQNSSSSSDGAGSGSAISSSSSSGTTSTSTDLAQQGNITSPPLEETDESVAFAPLSPNNAGEALRNLSLSPPTGAPPEASRALPVAAGPASCPQRDLLMSALKDCVFMGRLPCSVGCHMVLLHRSGAITLVTLEFHKIQDMAPGAPSRPPAGAAGASTSERNAVPPPHHAEPQAPVQPGGSSLSEVQTGLGNLRLPRWDGIVPDELDVPVVTRVECLSVRPPLDDEQPVDMALVSL